MVSLPPIGWNGNWQVQQDLDVTRIARQALGKCCSLKQRSQQPYPHGAKNSALAASFFIGRGGSISSGPGLEARAKAEQTPVGMRPELNATGKKKVGGCSKRLLKIKLPQRAVSSGSPGVRYFSLWSRRPFFTSCASPDSFLSVKMRSLV